MIDHDSMTVEPGHSKDRADSFQGKETKRYVSGVLAIDVNCYSSLMGHRKRGSIRQTNRGRPFQGNEGCAELLRDCCGEELAMGSIVAERIDVGGRL
jgi:hypothetical protein